MKIKKTTLLFVLHLIATIYLISTLDVSSWVDPDCCTLSCWFRYTVMSYANFIGITYLIFAWLFRFKWRETFSKLTGNTEFGDAMALVFILCGLCHFTHGLSYLSKYVKPSALIFYPPLIYYHIKLILMTEKVDVRLKKIKSPEEFEDLQNHLINLLRIQTEKTVVKFEKGFQKVYFDDIANMKKNEWITFVPGCDGMLLESNDKFYKIECIMTPFDDGMPSELETHEHPDCDEEFHVIEGEVYDKISGRTIKEGERHIFLSTIPHNPICHIKTRIMITGIKN